MIKKVVKYIIHHEYSGTIPMEKAFQEVIEKKVRDIRKKPAPKKTG